MRIIIDAFNARLAVFALVLFAVLVGCGSEREPLVVPVFAGFTDARYQQHDALIRELVGAFNANKAAFADATPQQAAGIPSLDAALVKAWMIQESGGNAPPSLAAWRKDPTQVNNPGDWSDTKLDLGLSKPERRNTGNLRTNLEASIRFLARKGFSRAATAPRDRPESRFDGWHEALRRYNGRTVMTTNGREYSQNYADRIIERADNPAEHVKIALPKPRG